MQLRESERVLAARDRWVARGTSTPALVVEWALGARIRGVDGKEYACSQQTGHGRLDTVA